ncbi:MAG TPA: homoserine O-acetyltransferase [Thermoanaerobaculia bacterium]|nr:homoserine O-acetyltransferase [Thermoanaerobaculia bacterium]
MTATFALPFPLILENGGVLDDVTVAYRTWGRLDADRANAVLICHALTGNADADEWWEPLIGSGRALDPARDFLICSNILGSCYGTTGPSASAGEFPRITVRDIVAVQRALVRHLGVRRLKLVIGGSFGGMQVLEWALSAPDAVEAIAPIATNGRHSPWTIAWSEAQRQAIALDPIRGLAIARMIAMSTYRSHASYQSRFARAHDGRSFAVEQWLRRHGDRLVARFDAKTYVTLTHAMDSHDVARGRGAYETVLASITQPALVVSIDSDILYPPAEQEELALLIPNATLRSIHSPHGHDGFLIDAAEIGAVVTEWRSRLSNVPRLRVIPRAGTESLSVKQGTPALTRGEDTRKKGVRS